MLANVNEPARNDGVPLEDLEDAIAFLTRKIDSARKEGKPLPPVAYRSKLILELAHAIRCGPR